MWDGNVILENPPIELINRDPGKVFLESKSEGNSWKYQFIREMEQFFKLLPQLSSTSDDKIKTLYNHLPFWLEHYWPIEEAMFKISPKVVLQDWRELILLDFSHDKPTDASEYGSYTWLAIGKNSRRHRIKGEGRPNGGKNPWRTRPTPEETIRGLNRLKELKDKDFLLEIMNHYDEHVRKEIQKMMKEIM